MRPLLLAITLLACATAGAQIIFTEYVEGSGHNKALEITNIGDTEFDLSRCRIGMYFNGSIERGQDFTLSALLPQGQSHVFHHHEAGGNYSDEFRRAVAAADSTQSAGFGWFNGNDAIVLECDGQVWDSLGQIGSDAYWGRDITLRRHDGQARTHPHSTWAPEPLGWITFPKNTFDGLGHR